MKRTGILTAAEALVHGDRHESYAHPLVDFARTAEMLTGLGFRRWKLRADVETPVGLPIGPSDIPAIMICVKLSRLMHKFDVDSLIDIAGYVETWGIIQDVYPEED
jgi:hypothetical protein